MNNTMTSASIAESTSVVSSGVTSAILSPSQQFDCRNDTPTSAQLFNDLPVGLTGYGFLSLYTFCIAAIFIIYIEELVFLTRNFASGDRLLKTIWILTLFPGFATTSYIAVLVPRAGVLCDLVSNVFFSTCLYQFHGLMEDYLGGKTAMWTLFGESRQMSLSVPPCCCCCGCCLPQPHLNRRSYRRLTFLIRQVAVVRPILQFIAAVLWTNGSFIPGSLLPSNAFLYLCTMNLISTLLSMWGLTIMKTITRSDLEQRFAVNGKFASVQLSMMTIALTNIIVGVLVTTNAIKCTALYSSKARAEAIAHSVFVVIMLPLSITGRFFYRRLSDSSGFGHTEDGKRFAPSNTKTTLDEIDIKQSSPQDVQPDESVRKGSVV